LSFRFQSADVAVIKLPTTEKTGENVQSSGLIQAVLDALPEPIFQLDVAAGALRPMNAAARHWSGGFLPCSDGAIDGAACFPELDLVAVSSSPVRTWFTHCINSATGQPCEVELQLHPLAGEGQQRIVVVRPISVRLGDESITHGGIAGAFHDPLTGLANRRLFLRRLERAIERAGKGHYHFGVLFVDLDNFKSVNDRFGHLQGDELLIAASRRLSAAVRPQDMVARRDGDEFTILLDDLSQPDDAVCAAQRIVEQLQAPLTLPVAGSNAAADMKLRASIGIAFYGDDVQTADEMLARADAAMYHAKALGGGTYMLLDRFTDQWDTELRRHKPLPR
jgi:diguanylate cyclase (GGDEF)-like protein